MIFLLFFHAFFSFFLLLFIKIKNNTSILRARVRPLSVHLSRIMNIPENLKQFFIAYFASIVFNFNNFSMSCHARANILITRFFVASSRVSRFCPNNAFSRPKSFFNSPETTCAKNSDFCFLTFHFN